MRIDAVQRALGDGLVRHRVLPEAIVGGLGDLHGVLGDRRYVRGVAADDRVGGFAEIGVAVVEVDHLLGEWPDQAGGLLQLLRFVQGAPLQIVRDGLAHVGAREPAGLQTPDELFVVALGGRRHYLGGPLGREACFGHRLLAPLDFFEALAVFLVVFVDDLPLEDFI